MLPPLLAPDDAEESVRHHEAVARRRFRDTQQRLFSYRAEPIMYVCTNTYLAASFYFYRRALRPFPAHARPILLPRQFDTRMP